MKALYNVRVVCRVTTTFEFEEDLDASENTLGDVLDRIRETQFKDFKSLPEFKEQLIRSDDHMSIEYEIIPEDTSHV